MKSKLIIFTDLDGTLLDSKYSFEKALPALRALKRKNIPLILCSSKTKTEIEHCRRKLNNDHPFISENGGGIFIPKKYFNFKISSIRNHYIHKAEFYIEEEKKHIVIRLGHLYPELRKTLKELRKKGLDAKGFGDMTTKEVAMLTGLPKSLAIKAKHRDFDEPFVFKGNKSELNKLKYHIKSKGLTLTQGTYYHVMGDGNKGRAVQILKKLFLRENKKLITIALGDNPNDIEMFKKVDYPVVVQKPDGSYDKRIRIKKIIKADGIGPIGWNRAVKKLLSSLLDT